MARVSSVAGRLAGGFIQPYEGTGPLDYLDGADDWVIRIGQVVHAVLRRQIEIVYVHAVLPFWL